MDQIIIKHLYLAINGNLATHGIKWNKMVLSHLKVANSFTGYYNLLPISTYPPQQMAAPGCSVT